MQIGSFGLGAIIAIAVGIVVLLLLILGELTLFRLGIAVIALAIARVT